VLAALRAAEIRVIAQPQPLAGDAAAHTPDLPDDMEAPGPQQP
jgi:hypothetical protein